MRFTYSGRAGVVSDVDLAVSGLPPKVFFRAMARARDILGREVDLVCLEDDNPFTRYLKEEGELERVAQCFVTRKKGNWSNENRG